MEIHTIPCLYDNYAYLIVDDAGRNAAIIDPSEAWPILQEIKKRELTLTGVICTHHHNDHIGGLGDLMAEIPDIRVIGLKQDQVRIGHLSEPLDDGASFNICGVDGQIMHTPGHTTSGVVYQLEDNIFTGDTLFGAGCGRLFEGTPEQMMRSLERICAAGPDTRLYFGHEYTEVNLNFAALIEPENEAVTRRLQKVRDLRAKGVPTTPSTVAEELQTNPFLRSGEPSITRHLENRYGLEDRSPLAVFTMLRELRNNFS